MDLCAVFTVKSLGWALPESFELSLALHSPSHGWLRLLEATRSKRKMKLNIDFLQQWFSKCSQEPMRLKWCSWDITGHFDCPSLLGCTVKIPRGCMGCDGMEKWESKHIWESLCLLSSHILRFMNVNHCHFTHLYFFIWGKMVAGDNSAGCH